MIPNHKILDQNDFSNITIKLDNRSNKNKRGKLAPLKNNYNIVTGEETLKLPNINKTYK